MTAQELFEIVKDVPKDAWPNDLPWEDMKAETALQSATPWYGLASRITVDRATMLFESSMLRWLAVHGDPLIRSLNEVVGYQHDDVPEWIGTGPTFVHALADACKKVQNI